jgi:hypothetical protein
MILTVPTKMTDKPPENEPISESLTDGIMNGNTEPHNLATNYDLTNVIEIMAPAAVAITIVVSYLVQVLSTGNTDSELGSSLPVIVTAYFVLHVSTANKRNV